MIRNLIAATTLVLVLAASGAHAQSSSPSPTPPSTLDSVGGAAEALRRDVQGGLKSAIAQNLKLTADEATRFWPVYEQYAADLIAVKAAHKDLVQEYAAHYGHYDDKEATQFIKRWLEVDRNLAELRINAIPRFSKVLKGLQVATFFQVERIVMASIDLQITSQLPLMQGQSDRPKN